MQLQLPPQLQLPAAPSCVFSSCQTWMLPAGPAGWPGRWRWAPPHSWSSEPAVVVAASQQRWSTCCCPDSLLFPLAAGAAVAVQTLPALPRAGREVKCFFPEREAGFSFAQGGGAGVMGAASCCRRLRGGGPHAERPLT